MNENMDENKVIEEVIETEDTQDEIIDEEENVIYVDAIVEEEEDDDDDEAEPFNLFQEIKEWVSAFAIAIAVVFVIKFFIFDVVAVDGQSMDTTLAHGQRLIITKLGYNPKAGDIIVLDSNYKDREKYIENRKNADEDFGAFDALMTRLLPPRSQGIERKYYIKRIIATEGQTVMIYPDGDVEVDGEILDEPYIGDNTTYPFDPSITYPYTVEEDHVFVMGDNREHSSDSRDSDLGSVPYDAILGRGALRIWPITEFGGIYK